MMWIVFALLSAIFAALTGVLAKVGLRGVDSDLATAIRTTVILGIAWAIAAFGGKVGGIGDLSRRSIIFLVLSGAATGASWLFYFRALDLGDASRVIPVDKFSVVISFALAWAILGESISAKTIAGCALITTGTIMMVL